MKQAFVRKVWWPLKLRQFDENGAESDGQAMMLVTVLDHAQLATYQETAVQALRDGIAAQQLRNLPAIGATPDLIAAREQEIAALDNSIAAKNAELLQTLRESTHSWRRLATEDGTDVPYSAATLEDLLRYDDFQQALANTLREASKGARAKN